MRIYFAQIAPAHDKKGAWLVDFPDLDGCFTYGDNLAEALANGRECLDLFLESAKEDNEILPEPSDLLQAREKARRKYRELDLPLPPETFYQAYSTGTAAHTCLMTDREADSYVNAES